MKRNSTLILALFFGLNAFSQKESKRTLSPFSEITVQEGISLILIKGSNEEASIKVDGLDLEDVKTEVVDGKLKIHLAGSNHRYTSAIIKVTYKNLKSISANSAASISGEGTIITADEIKIEADNSAVIDLAIKAKRIELIASNAANLKIKIESKTLSAVNTNAAKMEISGFAKIAKLDVSSQAVFDGNNLNVEDVQIETNSGGSTILNSKGKLISKESN